MNPIIEMYDFHKKAFNLKDSKLLRLFEELIHGSPCSIMECSTKITPAGLHPGRFRLGFLKKDIPEGMDAFFQFLDDIAEAYNIRFNRTILGQIFDNSFDLSRVDKLGIGVDNRENTNDSKVKCYLLIKDYPEKMNQALGLHPFADIMSGYPIVDMFAINVYFDGRTDIEVYPSFTAKDMKNDKIMDRVKLKEAATGFINDCKGLFVSFDTFGRRILYFNLQRPAEFVRLIGNHRLGMLFSNVQIFNYKFIQQSKTGLLRIIVALWEDEIISKDIKNIDLSYIITLPGE
jgi:LynF/TruF/PatF family peptide O-prenyltransferase